MPAWRRRPDCRRRGRAHARRHQLVRDAAVFGKRASLPARANQLPSLWSFSSIRSRRRAGPYEIESRRPIRGISLDAVIDASLTGRVNVREWGQRVFRALVCEGQRRARAAGMRVAAGAIRPRGIARAGNRAGPRPRQVPVFCAAATSFRDQRGIPRPRVVRAEEGATSFSKSCAVAAARFISRGVTEHCVEESSTIWKTSTVSRSPVRPRSRIFSPERRCRPEH